MPMTETTYGELVCRVIDQSPPDSPPEQVAILLHGFGAPGTDLVSLSDAFFQAKPELEHTTLFVFPQAPLDLSSMGMPGARAWWMLDIEKLNHSLASGEMRNLSEELPDGLEAAREQLIGCIQAIQKKHGLSSAQCILGGFSQGAMLSTDVMLHLDEKLGGLCILSGSLLCQLLWKEKAETAPKCPIVQSHGMQDPILPYAGAEWLKEMLTKAGFQIDFYQFDGQHTIPFHMIQVMGNFMLSNLVDPE